MKTALILATLIFTAVGAQAKAQEVVYAPGTIAAASGTRVSIINRDGQEFQVVRFADGDSIESPIDWKAAEVDGVELRPEEKATSLEDAREILELTLNQVFSDDFNGEMTSDGKTSEVLDATFEGVPLKRDNWLKRAFTINPELNKPLPKGMKTTAKMKRFAQNAWQFIFVETVHAGIDYVQRFKRAPKMIEFGFSTDIKVEPQIFIGKFNPTQKVKALRHSYGLALEISFNRQTKRLAIHTRLRREKGSGGLGLPSAKIEFKIFETDGTKGVQGGRSWYPVSPPLASFVFDRDHQGHYFAQGITFGLNTGDLIPGSTLTNTFADYQQVKDPVDFAKVMKRALPTKRTSALTCESIFN